ncbi:glycoside hydrolase [Foetidibacter luteolus]|uniref:glycoside hydrolase n=1 Tax=Foetidibacter luteolus TaxID=2608880 RepID=UPI001A99D2C0|nr:glycoside hydrolase [Foetidibacter luteolus]
MHKPIFIFCCITSLLLTQVTNAQRAQTVVISFDESHAYQTIDNFGASDAWACQFVGNWPDAKKNAVADWLFSLDTLPDGNPRGIGLSLWRYNLGAGSAEQQEGSGIKDEWRRAALTLGNSEKVQAQNWFLKAAQKRGVQQFLGFYNSPPVQFTKNGKAYATKGQSNIASASYQAFASYTAQAIEHISQATGVTFTYISPVNEPQWDWSDGGQEGCPYTNAEISGLVKAFSSSFNQKKLATQLVVTESGHLKYLLTAEDKQDKDNQVADLFQASSPLHIGGMPNVYPAIAAHSYFSTSPFADGMQLRNRVRDTVAQVKGLRYWQSEYCILGDNAGEIEGNRKDLGMHPALYIAKVIHEDLVGGNASAWQWWTAVSAYDYKDGLVYVDKNKNDGQVSDSKMLWALGNYSRFIRPGMQRVQVQTKDGKDLLVCGFANAKKDKLVMVLVNEGQQDKNISLQPKGSSRRYQKITLYKTSADANLARQGVFKDASFSVPAKSIVTVVME